MIEQVRSRGCGQHNLEAEVVVRTSQKPRLWLEQARSRGCGQNKLEAEVVVRTVQRLRLWLGQSRGRGSGQDSLEAEVVVRTVQRPRLWLEQARSRGCGQNKLEADAIANNRLWARALRLYYVRWPNSAGEKIRSFSFQAFVLSAVCLFLSLSCRHSGCHLS